VLDLALAPKELLASVDGLAAQIVDAAAIGDA